MSRRRPSARAVGIALGFLLDTAVGDPRRGHPVAAFGFVFSAVERRFCADSRARGVACTAAAVSSVAAIGWLGERMTRRSAGAKAGLVALATWACLGGTSLSREASVMTDHLQRGDVPAARQRLAHLCSRDAADLDEEQLARAAVESVAENTSDAVVAPLLWAAVGGAPGVLVHRAVNTLDAMVGYRTPRHLRFGWAAARLDDLLGLAPARLTAGLTVALAPLVGGAPAAALRAWRRDAPAHPSPNAGPVEAAFAGALGVRLGGSSTYAGHVEDRGTLGDGRPVVVGDLGRAVALSRAVAAAALVVAVVIARAAGGRRG
jgi:adenosylcobinamide-phosphate synthase